MKYLYQFVTTSLNVGGGIDASQTTGIVLQSLNNIDATKPSVACLTWADPLHTSVAEWVTYTSINSTTNELNGVTRGAEGYSAKTHENTAVVAFPLSKAHINELNDILTSSTGAITATKDEDTMSSNSATALATQQSIKAYVDSGTVTMTNKTLTSPVLQGDVSGWTVSTDTWVYASASTFTIAGVDRTTTFTPGTRLKFTQTTAKYAVVVSSSFSTDTTVTIAVNTDYTIANAAITSPYYSYQANPQGYPGWFNFTSAETWTNPPTSRTTYCKYAVTGRTAFLRWGTIGTANGSNSSSVISLTLPVNIIAATATRSPVLGSVMWTDNATFTDFGAIYSTSVSTITADLGQTTRKPTIVNISCSYEI